MMDLLRHLTLLALHNNIYICAVHIPGKHNDVADAISRFQYQSFQNLAPEADTKDTAIKGHDTLI